MNIRKTVKKVSTTALAAILACSMSGIQVLAANGVQKGQPSDQGVSELENPVNQEILIELIKGKYHSRMYGAVSSSAIQINETVGSFQIEGGTLGNDYRYENNKLTILSETPLTISGTTTTDYIVVDKGVKAQITLKDLSIVHTSQRPFDMTDAMVTLHLVGKNTLQSANFHAALYCPKNSDLVIEGPGTLTASTDSQGGAAAIGGESEPGSFEGYRSWVNGSCGSITINGGTINANSPLRVTARTNPLGAAIGGYGGGPIIINGGTINAIGEENSVGIGSIGAKFDGIFIRGGNITARSGGINMDDMGGSTAFGPAIGIAGAYVDSNGNGPKIEITGGIINAQGGFGTAGIGGGRNGSGGVILISGDANITAKGGFGAAGIGGGYAQNGGGSGGVITIEGAAKINAKGGENAAGIGGGGPRNTSRPGQPVNDGHSGIITIAGNADVTATGGKNAPGIGSGGPDATATFDGAAIVEKIVITQNAIVNATGGQDSPTNIGPGNLKGTGNASVEDRFLECIITTSTIQKPKIEAQNSLMVDENGNYNLKGNVVLNRDFTIPSGKTLTIETGAKLTVPSGVNLNFPEGAVIGDKNNIISDGGNIQEIKGDTYTLTIVGGTGGGSYQENAMIQISAVVPSGKVFEQWKITSGNGFITDVSASNTTVKMGNQNTVIEAIYKDAVAEVTGVYISPRSIIMQKGMTQQFTCQVLNSGVGTIDHSVTWNVIGNQSSDTKIDGAGILTIAKNETASSITVHATSNQDSTKNDSVIVTVTSEAIAQHKLTVLNGIGSGEYTKGSEVSIQADIPSGKIFDKWILTGIGRIDNEFSPNTIFIMGEGDASVQAVFKDGTESVTAVLVHPDKLDLEKGNLYPFTAEVQTNGSGMVNKSVTWSVSGNQSVHTTMSDSGMLTIAREETASTLTVTAVSNFDISKKGIATITVTDKPIIQYQLEVINGTGGGMYKQGELVMIQANSLNGKVFNRWIISGNGTVTDEKNPKTTFKMGAGGATVTAVYTNKQNNSSSSNSSDNSDDDDGKEQTDIKSSPSQPIIKTPISSSQADGEWRKGADGKWKYVHQNGIYAANEWILDNGKWYLLKEDNVMVTDWINIDGIWYYMDPSGAMATGWNQIGDDWYYLNTDGKMTTGWNQIEDGWYYLNTDGKMTTGWNQIGDDWYYLNTDGRMTTGWNQIEDDWYYLNTDGRMTTGWNQIEDDWYYLDLEGKMETGWKYFEDRWYYLQPNGNMATGWIEVNGDWYYLKSDGSCLINSVTPDGYQVDETGRKELVINP